MTDFRFVRAGGSVESRDGVLERGDGVFASCNEVRVRTARAPAVAVRETGRSSVLADRARVRAVIARDDHLFPDGALCFRPEEVYCLAGSV